MENFVVSARKYRPATFDTVVGQHSITTTLKNAIKNNHLAQAFLFCGPRGVGKTTCARILAKTINCSSLTPSVEACNECESCVSFNNQSSLNIYELDAASNNSVDDMRSLIEQVRFAPHSGKFKIYIIDEVHMLSTSAFNAFLKTLEEPPSYAIFILATTEKHKILPTILSRCQIFDFSRIQITDIAAHLAHVARQESIEADEDALHIIASKADGALRDSLSMFDQIVTYAGKHITYKAVIDNLNILDYDYYFKVTDFILKSDISNTLLIFNEILDNGFDGHNFINGLSNHFRDLMVCKDEVTLKLLQVSPGIRDKYRSQSRECQVPFLLEALDITNKTDVQYKSAKNQRLLVELALMKLCNLLVERSASQELKKKSEPGINQPSQPSQPAVINAAAPAARPAVNRITSAPVTSSINGLLNDKPKISRVEESKVEIQNSIGQDKPVNIENLLQEWKAYAQKIKQQGKHQFSATLLSREPEITEHIISFYVASKVQEEEFVVEKTNLMSFLRESLGNNKLSLQVTLRAPEVVSDEVPYTDMDKFRKMVQKNPSVEEMRKKLSLDFY